ncbi:hypothetical protein AB7M45_007883 [Bradyrhizobium elkanii]|uniref:hypothetical protein n=1 Tax=Bradyrhizobium elkanii TaxID=29448 RepID=UPI0009145A86|nr:hypothetical protein [Bradyrhizobium elkanii]MCW2195112.1 hypothetical protein [Bradyrhizobium elkanii]NWL67198.1 hypothetical protein [Bradyrhizobium elkanii]OIM93212.1 hypothetical protein BLN97_17565 [Bradyrhizobium elkanii]
MNMMTAGDPRDQERETLPAVVVESVMPAMLRAEIDGQIATAKAYPRNVSRAIGNIKSLATLDEETAAESLYALVRKKKQRGRGGNETAETDNAAIEGPSIRLAEIAAQCWGNCRIEAHVVTVNRKDKYVEAVGTFHDLETNMASTATVRRRISTSSGNLFSDDMITVTGNAACSIAKRNAILAGIPRGVYRPAYHAAREVVAGTTATLSQNRDKAIKAFAAYGVTPDQIFEALDVQGEADIRLDHIATLRGMFMSIKNGEATVEEMFAKEKPAEADPNYNPLVKNHAGGATDQQTTGGANEVGQTGNEGQTRQADASGTESRSAVAQESSQAGEKPAADSAAAEAAHPSGHAAGHQPAAGSDSAATPAQTSAKPAPVDAGTSQERTASGSSQPDLLSGPTSAQDGKAQSSSPQGSPANGADASRGRGASAPDLFAYHKALLTIENGGPPKLGKMSEQWLGKYGRFEGDAEKKRGEIYAAHGERLTGSIDTAACSKKVEGIIAR